MQNVGYEWNTALQVQTEDTAVSLGLPRDWAWAAMGGMVMLSSSVLSIRRTSVAGLHQLLREVMQLQQDGVSLSNLGEALARHGDPSMRLVQPRLMEGFAQVLLSQLGLLPGGVLQEQLQQQQPGAAAGLGAGGDVHPADDAPVTVRIPSIGMIVPLGHRPQGVSGSSSVGTNPLAAGESLGDRSLQYAASGPTEVLSLQDTGDLRWIGAHIEVQVTIAQLHTSRAYAGFPGFGVSVLVAAPLKEHAALTQVLRLMGPRQSGASMVAEWLQDMLLARRVSPWYEAMLAVALQQRDAAAAPGATTVARSLDPQLQALLLKAAELEVVQLLQQLEGLLQVVVDVLRACSHQYTAGGYKELPAGVLRIVRCTPQLLAPGTAAAAAEDLPILGQHADSLEGLPKYLRQQGASQAVVDCAVAAGAAMRHAQQQAALAAAQQQQEEEPRSINLSNAWLWGGQLLDVPQDLATQLREAEQLLTSLWQPGAGGCPQRQALQELLCAYMEDGISKGSEGPLARWWAAGGDGVQIVPPDTVEESLRWISKYVPGGSKCQPAAPAASGGAPSAASSSSMGGAGSSTAPPAAGAAAAVGRQLFGARADWASSSSECVYPWRDLPHMALQAACAGLLGMVAQCPQQLLRVFQAETWVQQPPMQQEQQQQEGQQVEEDAAAAAAAAGDAEQQEAAPEAAVGAAEAAAMQVEGVAGRAVGGEPQQEQEQKQQQQQQQLPPLRLKRRLPEEAVDVAGAASHAGGGDTVMEEAEEDEGSRSTKSPRTTGAASVPGQLAAFHSHAGHPMHVAPAALDDQVVPAAPPVVAVPAAPPALAVPVAPALPPAAGAGAAPPLGAGLALQGDAVVVAAAAAGAPFLPGAGPAAPVAEQQQQQQQEPEQEPQLEEQQQQPADDRAAAVSAHTAAVLDVTARLGPAGDQNNWLVTMGTSMPLKLKGALKAATWDPLPAHQQQQKQQQLQDIELSASLARQLQHTMWRLLAQAQDPQDPAAGPLMHIRIFDQGRGREKALQDNYGKVCACQLLPSGAQPPTADWVLRALQSATTPAFRDIIMVSRHRQQPIPRMSRERAINFTVIAYSGNDCRAGTDVTKVFLRAVATAACILYGIAELPARVSNLLHHGEGCAMMWQSKSGTELVDTPEGERLAADMGAVGALV